MQQDHPVVSQEEWLAARKALLVREKELTHQREAVTAARMALPWVQVEKDYVFDTECGPKSLGDLFDGRSQLIIQHFMFGPGWEQGCRGCSFMLDHMDPTVVHIAHHDVTFVVVSRAPLAEILPFRRRMGWDVPWVSSFGSDFNKDFHVSFTPEEVEGKAGYYNYEVAPVGSEEKGFSVFTRNDAGEIFHSYSRFGRGVEDVLTSYVLLEMTPKGRNEKIGLGEWVLHHDRYEGDGRTGPATGVSCHAEAVG
jgi:predicted dithiol-disulfide oxidoreductase (DUF899 family)